jgi:membrane-bound lytic murein transglycosylase B
VTAAGRRAWLRAGAAALATGAGVPALAQDPPATLRADIAAFEAAMLARHPIDPGVLRAWLAAIRFDPGVVRRVTNPATARPWREFRAGLLGRDRVEAGRAFALQWATTLAAVAVRWGVPAPIVVAILGIETFWGRDTGRFRLLDALGTLAFEVPARAAFFRDELAQLLLLGRDGWLDPLTAQGSFAGAIGLPQFLPSNVRTLAVDFDGDGRADLVGSVPDAIASVARYLAAFGWRAGDDVLLAAAVEAPERVGDLLASGALPMHDARRLWDAGVSIERAPAARELLSLLRFDGDAGPEWRVGLHNFWVITRYNRSHNYARAVVELARAVEAIG